MDKARKKELQRSYAETKPEMGILIIRRKDAKECCLEASTNLRSRINSGPFKLRAGSHPCRELQAAWTELGEDKFEIAVLEKLEYDKDESKTDYSADLALREEIWREELAKEGMKFYKK